MTAAVIATVLVTLGVLYMLAVPKFAATREKASIVALRSDLRNLWAAQDDYAETNRGTYMPSGVAAAGAPHKGFEPSRGVEVKITNTGSGWSASAWYKGAVRPSCTITAGKRTPSNPSGIDGPNCDENR